MLAEQSMMFRVSKCDRVTGLDDWQPVPAFAETP